VRQRGRQVSHRLPRFFNREVIRGTSVLWKRQEIDPAEEDFCAFGLKQEFALGQGALKTFVHQLAVYEIV